MSVCSPNLESSCHVAPEGPFFTVLIPTMNRPKLLKAAIETAMGQTFGNFELIVSDNSNDETCKTLNRRFFSPYANDPRAHIISPPHWMNMPDHWEFASRHASGRYVLILTDRHVMLPSALEFLFGQIKELQDDGKVISWSSGPQFKHLGHMNHKAFTGDRLVLNSLQELCFVAQCSDWAKRPIWANRLPRMLNSCYRFDVAQAIREKHGRLFMPLSPDLTCSFLLTAYTETFAYIDSPLYLSNGYQSGGKHCAIYGNNDYFSALGDIDLCPGTPAHFDSITDYTLRDFLMVKTLVGERLANVDLDLIGYLMSNYREFMYLEQLGSQRDIGAMYRQWWEHVGKLPDNLQEQIKANVREIEKQRPSFIRLRRLARRWGLIPLGHAIVDKTRDTFRMLSGKPVYANALDAAKHMDHILSR